MTHAQTKLFTHREELFAVQRLHDCLLPRHETLVRYSLQVKTTEFGQKIFLGLAAFDLPAGSGTPAGIGITVDPETGLIEDVFGEGGMLGDVRSAPQAAGETVTFVLQARFYGLTFIPTLQIGNERVALPARLLEPGQKLSALAGGVLSQGALPRFEHSELTLCPLSAAPMMHG